MNGIRRRIVMQAGAAAAIALAIPSSWRARGSPIVDVNAVANDSAVLFLHDGRAREALPRDLCASLASCQVREVAVDLLTMPDFTRVGALLDGSRGSLLLSLLDDGDSIVMETLLQTRGAHVVRLRHGSQALLRARL